MDSTQRTRPRTGGSPVGLVIFIILTVAFAVLAYWAFAEYQKSQAEVNKMKGTVANAELDKKRAQDQVAAFQKITGVETADSLKEFITSTLEMTRAEGFGAESEETAKAGLNAAFATISQVKIALNSLNSNFSAELAAHKSLEDTRRSEEEAYKKSLAEQAAEIQDIEKKMADERARLLAQIDQEVSAREALLDQFYTEQDQYKIRESKNLVHIAELQQKLRELSGEGAILEEATGRVTDVDLRNNMASLNIGSSGGTKTGMRFVAFSKDATGRPVKKGVIEIVRTGADVSAGRIVSVDPGLAVGKGDYVYNLAGPSQKMFVFAGEPQLYTIEQWNNIIKANGGIITDAVQQGDQVADYLVLGTFEDDDKQAMQMIFDARDFGLKIIKEADLKNAMGLK